MLKNIEASWKTQLLQEFSKPYFENIQNLLKAEIKEDKKIYPPSQLTFNAFNLTPFTKVKAVIIGQDPYHNPGQAMGLSFSVPRGIRIPPSLRNIYKELNSDLAINIPTHGDLSSWALEGVLLLNVALSVEHKKPTSHKSFGWEKFSDAVIEKISMQKSNVVFLLWGNFAKSKKKLIDSNKHFILEAAHPSPLARGAYFGSKHFSKTNAYLKANGMAPINWKL